jgi:hypothetical protein
LYLVKRQVHQAGEQLEDCSVERLEGSLKGKINTHHAGRSDGKEKTNMEIYRPPGGGRGNRRLKYKELSYQVGRKEEWAVSRGCINVVGTTMLAKGTT